MIKTVINQVLRDYMYFFKIIIKRGGSNNEQLRRG